MFTSVTTQTSKSIHNSVNFAVVPAGVYFLCDPCYLVPDNLWDSLLNSSGYFETSSKGTVTMDGEEYTVFAFSTAYGDGEYEGSDGKKYDVDSGLIGLVPIGLVDIEEAVEYNRTRIEFYCDTVITNDSGNMSFVHVTINTRDDCDDYDPFDLRY